ncbi:3-keto-disaccharide hydrolase [Blastopirellula retiformator]|uniref:3-keto-alpha-glucoside-1,2-lyase/3-keto-2-hydroxy-glucal hydratase domain-containing protein n=1 Tax=Blastopirellula retiformator TaxID=2527970 RepID=A0A5C5V6R3_9BACT|nr:DUF1080 domain-containing protein [Blastopirellula retiformator]TWT33402.1 hypothetical protein Enr8_32320 [Blastopirellula retiformator]
MRKQMGKFAARFPMGIMALVLLSTSVCWASPFDSGPDQSETQLFNQRDLQGWRPAICCDAERLTPAERELLSDLAAQDMNVHWQAAFGILQYDGRGKPIETERQFGPCILSFQWKCDPCSTATIGLPGDWSVVIGDAHSDGADERRSSGAIYCGCRRMVEPLRCTDQPLGEWNHMTIRVRQHQIDVWLNGCRIAIADNIKLNEQGSITIDGGPAPLYLRHVTLQSLEDHPSRESKTQLP